jgi:signal transduction histidine kinase
MNNSFFGSLFWRISAVFFILLLLVGFAFIATTTYYSAKYTENVVQKLNRNTAKNIVTNSTNFYNGKVIKPALDEMFHHVMAINPSLEVYLVEPKGRIIAYYPPEKKLKLKAINLIPVLDFIKNDGNISIKGNDPLNPETDKIFSASELKMNDMLYAYIYVVLTGQVHKDASDSLFSNYLLEISAGSMFITLLATLLIGLLIIRVITNNYSKIIGVMQKFKSGDLSARVKMKAIGEEKQIGDIFNEMADILTLNIDKLKQVENLRRELIANVSHDLRTPIAIIQGYIETLQMKANTITEQDRQKYTNTIKESAEKLDKLINELFELSKLEANQVKAKKEPFIIGELVSDITSKYHLMAESKNITINTQLNSEIPPVHADISLIERVMQNLIDNAMKFTPTGGKILVKTIVGKNGTAEISVADNGIGVPENEREQIFARYYKGNNFTDLQNNTGLGLAIVRKILDLHNSTLQLISNENRGSEFVFNLPLAK